MKLDISSGEALKYTLIAAKVIVLFGEPSGGYMTGLFQPLSIADAIKSKIKQLAPCKLLGEALARD